MTTILCIILAAALAAAVAGLLRARSAAADARLSLARAEADFTVRLAELQARLQAKDSELDTRLDSERRAHEAAIAQERRAHEAIVAEVRRAAAEQLARERETAGERFKSIAAEVLQLSSRQLDERSRAGIEAVLAPMRASLDTFTKNFRDAYTVENTERLSVREQLQTLAELNLRVSEETRHLTRALQGNTRWQGRWGEMVLKNILEASGLEQGRCLELQATSRDDEGDTMRPDAIITCPDERRIIIDSKAPLTAFLKFTQAVDDKERDELLRAHVRAVEAHVSALREKSYQTRLGVEAADFVLMFIPHEGAYIACMDASPELWMRAFDSHVIIVSPTHLVTVIKLVEQMWHNADRNANAAVIATEAGRLLEKLNGFLRDMGAMSDALDKARASYDAAISKLSTGRGSVLSRADRMRRLGAKAGPLPDRYLRDLPAEPDPE